MDLYSGQYIYYDLTHNLLSSAIKQRYGGVERVVEQIGIELYKQTKYEIRYVVFSHGYGKFFEIHPKFICDGESIDLNIPTGIKQRNTRKVLFSYFEFRDLFRYAITPLVNMSNRILWNSIASNLTPVEINGELLISCGDPRHIVDIISVFNRRNISCNIVPMLHDLIPINDLKNPPIRYQQKSLCDYEIIIQHANIILTNSEFTHKELLRFSTKGILPDVKKIYTLQLAHECIDGVSPPKYEPLIKPYILTVGSTLGRKNLEVVFNALSILQNKMETLPTLVIAGRKHDNILNVLNTKKYAKIKKYIEYRYDPNQNDMIQLYRNSLVVIVPSRIEGWGLPAGEALWCGTPVICSNIPVLKEVCKDLALYFNPDRPEILANYIQRLFIDPELIRSLQTKIKNNKCHLRSWNDVAIDLIDIISTKL